MSDVLVLTGHRQQVGAVTGQFAVVVCQMAGVRPL